MQAVILRVIGNTRLVEGKPGLNKATGHMYQTRRYYPYQTPNLVRSVSAQMDGKSHLCCFQEERKDQEKELRSRKQPPMAGPVIWVAVSPVIRKWG